MEEKIKLGVSACLLGDNVRYNGGNCRDHFLTDTLSAYVEWVPVCPEVECGLGIPRETLRLVGDPEDPRLVTTKTGIDHTEKMRSWAVARLEKLERENLCGFIFKSKSPSSGWLRVKVYHPNGGSVHQGTGIFAKAFTRRFPRLPVEEEGRLCDPGLRENFIERIFALRRWRETVEAGMTAGGLVDFHTRNKLLILAHGEKHYRAMGKLVAQGKTESMEKLYDQYESLFMEALTLQSTVRKNSNVLMHAMGYFKKQLTSDEKAELLELLDAYRRESIPLIVPVTLINHYVRKYDQPYLKIQTYLNPHPLSLRLRNHA
ncbi:MAG: YbgA family protein [Thermodesulfobacteriota bacterium]